VSSVQILLYRIRTFIVASEITIILISNFYMSYLRFGRDWSAVFFEYPGQPKILIYPLLWLSAMSATHAWDKALIEMGNEFFTKILNAAWRSLLLFGCFAFLAKFPISRLWVIGNIICTVTALLLFRSIIRYVLSRHLPSPAQQKYLYIGSPESVEFNLMELNGYLGFTPKIDRFDPNVPRDGAKWVNKYIEKIETGDYRGVIVGYGEISDAGQLRYLADTKREKFTDFIIVSRISSLIPRMEIQESPTIVRILESHVVGSGAVIKRLFDIFFSIVSLVLLSPLLLLIAILVKITSRGPVLYVDERVGQSGKTFKFPKFRSMYVGADQKRLEILGRPDENMAERYRKDPRITPFGKFLRRWSLDELPQLWTVFIGQMSVVGPRPILCEEMPQVKFEYQLRFIAKPGLTGLWQVTGRKEVPWEDRMLRDLSYVEKWTFSKDLVLILRTIRAIITGEGAH
jgi:exopolysaccharide biosynthesis polyprenyl glycosylphosphotransferase